MWPCDQACAPHAGLARSKRQSMMAHSGSARWAASSDRSMSVLGMGAFSVLRGCRYNHRTTLGEATDGDRRFLGQRQSLRVAGTAGARVQAAALRQPPAAVLQAGTQIPADARAQSTRACAGAEGRGLRVLRVARDPLLPRP